MERLAARWKGLTAAALLLLALMQAVEWLVLRPAAGMIPSLDPRAGGFTTAEAAAWLTKLGESDGTTAVLAFHYLSLDLVFPALFTAAMAAMLVAAGDRLARFAMLPSQAKALLAATLVVPYAVADYAQNVAVMRLLLSGGPEPSDAAVALASGLNVAKFALLAPPLATIAVFALKGMLGKARLSGEDRPR